MKKLLLLIPLMCLLAGCSSHRVYSINTDKLAAGKFLENFAITNGFQVIYSDAETGIYRIETEDLKLKGGFYGGIEQSHPTGFGIRMKEVNPNCTALYTDSFGLGLRGYTYNKRKRLKTKAQGEATFQISKDGNCGNDTL